MQICIEPATETNAKTCRLPTPDRCWSMLIDAYRGEQGYFQGWLQFVYQNMQIKRERNNRNKKSGRLE